MSKVVVISGSSGGLGKALVETYVKEDFFVLGLDKKPSSKPTETQRELELDLHNLAKDEKYRKKFFKSVGSIIPTKLEKFVLINNAAEQIIGSISELNWQEWEKSFAVNSVAPFFLAQGFINQLIQARGHIVNISSIHTKLTKPKFTCYASSKSALESLTRSLSLELSPKGISVNAISPSAINTKMLRKGFKNKPEKMKILKDFHPSNSIGSPSDLAHFVKLITESKGGFLTGSVIEYSGGIGSQLSDPDN
tara:strand:+ start:477 stop:1229 length:753 start_codon:yes stop_codon:yes gene_type:complete